MKNKGFTLVELLAVITLLALLSLAAFTSLDSVNRKNKEQSASIQVDQILSAAISYVPTSSITLPNVISETGCRTLQYRNVGDNPTGSNICEVRVSLNYLYKEGVLEETITDPVTGDNLNMRNSYVSIVYVTSGTKSNYSDVEGKYDGPYFYQLVEAF